jgi:hypothetical protein
VIDWESVEEPEARRGPALMDLLYFVTHWFFAATRAHDMDSRRRAFAELLFDRSSTRVRAAHDAVASYMTALDIPGAFLPVAHVATWVHRAIEQHARCGELGRSNPHAELIAVLAGNAERLFTSRA